MIPLAALAASPEDLDGIQEMLDEAAGLVSVHSENHEESDLALQIASWKTRLVFLGKKPENG